MTNNTVVAKFIFIFLFTIVLLVANISTANAISIRPYDSIVYNLDYAATTQYLLKINGKRTTNSDLYFISCVARTHLQRKEDISDLFFHFPDRTISPTTEQIEIVKNVLNNTDNKCYDLYIVLPLHVISKDDPSGLITVISNNLAFISYDTFILITVRPNL